MSSFLSNSAIDMSGSDFGISIEQSMMDREVISIGGSSLEDTPCGAFNSEFSFLERVRASRHIGRGTSRPRGRVRPSTTSDESVSVNVILLPFAFRGLRRGSGGGDARASPRLQCSHSTRSSSSTPAVVGCEWVKDDILKYKSSFTSVAIQH